MNIPASVRSIGVGAFRSTVNLVSVDFEDGSVLEIIGAYVSGINVSFFTFQFAFLYTFFSLWHHFILLFSGVCSFTGSTANQYSRFC